MSLGKELPFTSELWKKLSEYLEKHAVGGRKLITKPLGSVSYYNKTPDIVITDEVGIPLLIVETKRKVEGRQEDLYDPFGPAPIAQALCYAVLALQYHNLKRTPLFATATRDVLVLFKGIERGELEKLVDIGHCRKEHRSPEDWVRAFKRGAYVELLKNYIIDRFEKPLSDVTIKWLFECVERWILGKTLAPAQLYRVLVEEFRFHIEELHGQYVEEAVKARILEDSGYFTELHKLARKQGYRRGLLSLGLFSLRPREELGVGKKVCNLLAEEIARRLSGATSIQDIFNTLRDITEREVRELLVEYCEKAKERAPRICNERVREIISFRNLSRMMTYVLAAKILAYKILELHYHDIPNLKPLADVVEVDGKKIEVRDSNDIIKALNEFFTIASGKIEKRTHVRDFKPLFETGLYDKIVFKGLGALRRINALIETADAVKEALKGLSGIIGFVYESFIPPSERHQLGEFYTPPAVARLITKWCIRSGRDKVLDGGCGSGTFLIEAYKRLLYEMFNKVYGDSYPSCRNGLNEHQEILRKLYGVDINAFATQLTALHLMLMEPRCPFSELNVTCRDYFSFEVKEEEKFDAIVGNPPYTRWVEIPDETQELIKEKVGDLAKNYDLVADLKRGREPGIYVYWILHATKNLLKDGGRLGMIISNMWLQTDYGIDFGRFLLDHYKIKALIDISYRLFEALISTVIVLAEKESDKSARDNNEVLLVRIPPIDSKLSNKEVETKLDTILKLIEDSITPNYGFNEKILERCREEHGVWYGFVKQSEIPRDKKWISLFFKSVEDVVKGLEVNPLMIRVGEWFKPSYGNALYLCLTSWGIVSGVRNLGAKEFFYFNEEKITDWNEKVEGFEEAVRPYLVPAITASRYVKTFTFTNEDWEEIKERGEEGRANAYILVLHEVRERLPPQLQSYIKWGETECRTKIRKTRGGGRICSEAEACKARQRAGRPYFYGWYDLGGCIPTPVMAIRQARYHPQFFLVAMPLVTYDAIIALIPRVKVKIGNEVYDPSYFNKAYNNIIDDVKESVELNEVELKAILAYLNSTFNWLWLEQNARYIAKGPLGLEVNVVERMPIPDVKRLDKNYVNDLAKLFDDLDSTARQFINKSSISSDSKEGEEEGGAKLEMFKALRPIFRAIDNKVSEVLGLTVDVDELWNYAWEMMERRIKGAGREVRPRTEVEVEVAPKRRKGKRKRKKASRPWRLFTRAPRSSPEASGEGRRLSAGSKKSSTTASSCPLL
jgi:type I restriction-modification system DNA methylase subunit